MDGGLNEVKGGFTKNKEISPQEKLISAIENSRDGKSGRDESAFRNLTEFADSARDLITGTFGGIPLTEEMREARLGSIRYNMEMFKTMANIEDNPLQTNDSKPFHFYEVGGHVFYIDEKGDIQFVKKQFDTPRIAGKGFFMNAIIKLGDKYGLSKEETARVYLRYFPLDVKDGNGNVRSVKEDRS
ncbi:MAG: hypothetical protein WCJ19_00935 [bacterium]